MRSPAQGIVGIGGADGRAGAVGLAGRQHAVLGIVGEGPAAVAVEIAGGEVAFAVVAQCPRGPAHLAA